MWLLNCNIPGRQGPYHIQVEAGKISQVSNRLPAIPRGKENSQIYFDNSLAFPGLINSHDHLDFSLFPPIANKKYTSYVEWGADIQTKNKSLIDSVTKVPPSLSIQWGIYKNLLAGVTTVVNHGNRIETGDELINVFQDCQSIHSIARGKNWRLHLNSPKKKKLPVVIHVGEGTNYSASREIDTLLRWNLFHRSIIGVHGIAMTEKQASKFKALVWCPVSNCFLYGQTAPVDKLWSHTSILFGSDSTLTGSWNFWDHLRIARNSKLVFDEQIFDMLTNQAAAVWHVNSGKIEKDRLADIVIAKPANPENNWDSFYGINPEHLQLVMRRGSIQLFDETLMQSLQPHLSVNDFSKVYINGVSKYVKGNLPALIMEIKKHNPDLQFPVSF